MANGQRRAERAPAPGCDAGTAPALPAEFSLIGRHFRPVAGPGSLDLRDDAAVLSVPPGRQLVTAADAIVAGLHFLPDDPPDLVARKLLRVNLSDLAAMGAVPLGHLVALSAPQGTPDGWFAAFAQGLGEDGERFGSALLGGDTTGTTGPVTLSCTVLGHVGPGRALLRSGARPGDELWVTGTVGDGALGLLAARGELPDPDGFLRDRYRLPQPRLGLEVSAASAGMDVSDGLAQDVGHLCRESGVGAEVHVTRVPLSPAARAAVAQAPALLERCLTGGDDYELVLAVPPGNAEAMRAAGRRSEVALTRIGRFVHGEGVRVLNDLGTELSLARAGWSHF